MRQNMFFILVMETNATVKHLIMLGAQSIPFSWPIGLFCGPASAPQLVLQRLWDSIYKRSLAVNQSSTEVVTAGFFSLSVVLYHLSNIT